MQKVDIVLCASLYIFGYAHLKWFILLSLCMDNADQLPDINPWMFLQLNKFSSFV